MFNAYALYKIIYDEKNEPVDLEIIDFNKSFKKISRLKKKNLLHKSIFDIYPSIDKSYFEKLNELSNNTKPLKLTFLSNKKNQKIKVYAYSPSKGFLVTIVKKTSKAIDFNKKVLQLHTAIEQSPITIVITDENGVIEYVNPKFTKTTGYTKEEAIGEKPSVLKSGEQPNEYYKELWEIISSGNTWRGVFHNKRKNGSLYWESVLVSPVTDNKGKIINYIAIKEDVTYKRKLENDLIKAKELSEQADKLKTSFLANVSHEIRTPLNAIIGFSEFIAKDISERDKSLYIEIIKNSSNDLLNIINSILDIAKIESGISEINNEEFSINAMLLELFEYYQFKKSKLNKEKVEIRKELKISDENAIIISDKGKLKQVLVNLLENAFKFTSVGNINFGCKISDKNDFVELFVKDTGIGVSEEKQKIIFERFRQVDESTSRLYGGTGLGLSISKGFVELMGGEINVKSRENVGTEFNLRIPYKSANTSSLKSIITSKIFNIPKGKKLLVVEDVYSNFELVNEILSDKELEIIHALTGLDAINLFKENSDIDLILMDIRLPDINGYEVTNIIKSINPDVKIIALTAYAMKSDRKAAYDAGCDDFLSKPYDEKKLLSLVEKNLSN